MNVEYINTLKGRITSYLRVHEDYQYIDDIRIDLLEPRTRPPKRTSFNCAMDSLIHTKAIILCGNRVKI